jgi:WhiB family redox-sensing transcriptional regulator
VVAYDVTVWTALMVGVECLEVADLLDRPSWMADALCAEYPLAVFFPHRGEDIEPARAVCRACLVRRECLAYALPRGDLHGVWGGSSRLQRKQARQHGLDVDELLEAVDTRKRDASPSTWETAPCRGCGGVLSRRDVESGDQWCWACRPPSVSPDRATMVS